MVNLEIRKVWPPYFKKTCPWTIVPPPFFNFSDSTPSGGANHNLLPPFKKGEGGGGPNYVYIYGNHRDI